MRLGPSQDFRFYLTRILYSCVIYSETQNVNTTSIAGWLVIGQLQRLTVPYSTHYARIFLKRTRKTT